MAQLFTFPQSGDADDAEHFGAMIGHNNMANFVADGLTLTPDYTVPELSVSTGKAFIQVASDTASSSGDTILKVNRVVQVPAQTVSLADSATNYVYLEPDFSTDDNGTVSAYTSTQPGNALLVATVDTTADTITRSNYAPSGVFEQLALGDDEAFIFGSDDDYYLKYDAANDVLSIEDSSNNDVFNIGDTLTDIYTDVDFHNHDLNDVATIDGGGDKIQFDDDIDLTGFSLIYDDNAGAQELVDMAIGGGSPVGTEHSYDFRLDDTVLLEVYAESDGAGGIQNAQVDLPGADLDLNNNNITDVAQVDGGGDDVIFTDNIDINNNTLTSGSLNDELLFDSAGSFELRVNESGGTLHTLSFSDDGDLTGTLAVSSGVDFDMAGGNIDDVASIDGGGNAVVFNDSITANGDITLSNNNLNDVATIDGGGDKVQFDDDIDLTGQGILYDGDAGAQELVDMPVSGSSVAGTEHSYDFKLDNVALLEVYAESDGAGTIQNSLVNVFTDLHMRANDITNVNGLFGTGGGDPIDINTDLDFLSNGAVNLTFVNNGGSSINFLDDIDLSGQAIDGAFSITGGSIDLEGTGSDTTVILDGAFDLVFENDANTDIFRIIEAGGVRIHTGDLFDGASNVVYDQSNNWVPQARLENDSVTVTAGDGLKNGGSVALGASTTLNIEPADFSGFGVEDDGSDNIRIASTAAGDGIKGGSGTALAIEPADFAGTFLSDDGADNLQVDIGTGVENDGSGNIRLNEDYQATWTTLQTFSAGLSSGANVDMNTNQVANLPAPTATHHAARKGYVDGVAQGLSLKDSSAAASESNVNLGSATDPNPIDGYSLSNGERVLLKSQTDGTENGIYVANTATDPTTWTRAPDMDEDAETTNGSFTFIENGTENANTSWIITTDDPITLGVTSINWQQFSQAGEFTAGDGLTLTGQTFSVDVSDFAGTGLEDDGSENLRISSGAAGDGISGGSGSALSVNATDIAGQFLGTSSNNLQVNIDAATLEGSGGNIRVNEDFDFTFTSQIDFANGFNSQSFNRIDNSGELIQFRDTANWPTNDYIAITGENTSVPELNFFYFDDSASTSTNLFDMDSSSVNVPNTPFGVLGTNGSASSDNQAGLGAPTVYTEVVEASSEKGGLATYMTIGDVTANSAISTAPDEFNFVTDGVVQATLNQNTFDINAVDRLGLPTLSSDPSANVGDVWYRTDLD